MHVHALSMPVRALSKLQYTQAISTLSAQNLPIETKEPLVSCQGSWPAGFFGRCVDKRRFFPKDVFPAPLKSVPRKRGGNPALQVHLLVLFLYPTGVDGSQTTSKPGLPSNPLLTASLLVGQIRKSNH